ncbi:TetR/AcrR family transcriptional regulator [Agromyces italicus]|uniref:TetR/AcrR family transcriptional regulator n=1 Tax=Agromyces italicus TaxID=279572 RepID=UPI0003B3838F|nr:TetR/AcrR family transcriptional regulator [Agromyces italicus]
MQLDSEDVPMSRRSEEKRQQILDAALTVFVANGYVGTSTDQVAAAASVSKQTIYRYFADKEGLFTALITDIGDRIHNPFDDLTQAMRSAQDAESAIKLLAEQFTRSIMNPRVQEIRRLVIAEAARFPDLGRLYWQRGFERVLESVATCLRLVAERGLLSIPQPAIAAQHLTGMLLWIPSNRVMFCGPGHALEGDELTGSIESGVRAFIAAYLPEAKGAQRLSSSDRTASKAGHPEVSAPRP